MTASSIFAGVLRLGLPDQNPASVRLSHGSSRSVLLLNVISQALVPNHLNDTPLVPGPPFLAGWSAPSASPGKMSELPRFAAPSATPVTRAEPKKPRRESN